MNRLYSVVLILFIISVAIYGTLEWRASLDEEKMTPTSELTPDFIAEALNSDFYNEHGALSYEMEASRMEHF